MAGEPYPLGPGWDAVLAARAGNYTDREQQVKISIDRRADGANGEVKFELAMRPLDQHHTHGEMTRCDQQAIRTVLAKAADEIVAILRQVPQEQHHLPIQPVPPSMLHNGVPFEP